MSNTEVLLIKGLMSEMTDEDQTRCKDKFFGYFVEFAFHIFLPNIQPLDKKPSKMCF